MKWVKGRQHGCSYKKLKIWEFRIWKWGFDAYLLRYKAPTRLKWHTDPVKNGKHWRLNLTLKGRSMLLVDKKNGFLWSKRLVLFRSDLHRHMLSVFTNTLKLSLGFVKFK